MSDILNKILAHKRLEVAEARAIHPLSVMQAAAREADRCWPVRDFAAAIVQRAQARQPAVIAEIKRASPSAGAINATLDPAAVAASYAAGGAACLSVLTDREFFKGSVADLQAARAACELPVIRKDFIVDPYQIVEARAMGADAVLFIIGAAPIEQFRKWEVLARSLGLSVLAEVHDAAQLAEALTLKTPLIGVNNRDLRSFTVNLQQSVQLKSLIPADRVLVSESGIAQPADVALLRAADIHAFLIGTSLVGQTDPGQGLQQLLG